MIDHIHTVDIAKIGLDVVKPSEDDFLSIGHQIVETFQLTGFAYLKNHGVSAASQDGAFQTARQFFAREMSEKLKYERFSRCGYNGYTPPGGENTGYANSDTTPPDYKECFDLSVLEKSSDWPDVFDSSVRELTVSCWSLVGRLLHSIDLALQTNGQLVAAHSEMLNIGSFSTLRLLNYPAVKTAGSNEGRTRCAAHTDYGTMTLLIQQSEPGLEVETSPEHWTQADPVPGTLLINIGDMMEIWTSGRLKATLHRVLTPQSSCSGEAAQRQSIAFFAHPNNGVVVSPFDGDQTSYKSVIPSQFVRDKFAMTYPNYRQWLKCTDSPQC